MSDIHRKIKLLMIGDSGVGKTSLLDVYTRRGFSTTRWSTIGIEYASKYIDLDGTRIKLEIWDTAGQERFQSIPASYYRNVDGVLLVYDVTDCNSFTNVHKWMRDLRKNDGATAVKILVGNKCDIRNDTRHVSTTSGLATANEYGVTFSETSAKDNVDVDATFLRIASDVNTHINLHGPRRRPDSFRFTRSPVAELQEKVKWCFC